MTNNRSTFIQSLNNPKGQVALFIALIFQVLFLFFAMVINVGLLVHHKINLQNSVDLAAYYGAMKQAEGMNAIAHINYQIRQSYKLLTWRYRMVGTAGDFTYHPYDKLNFNGPPKGGDGEDAENTDFFNAPAFCATYVPFKPMPPGENTCQQMGNQATTGLFTSPAVIYPLGGFSAAIRNYTEIMRAAATRQCKVFGSMNYLVLGTFVTAFNMDQRNRNFVINAISRNMSNSTDDFYDIDGRRVSEGIDKTLRNNLTEANKDDKANLNIEIYNSLGHANCKSEAGEGAPKWLVPVKVFPGFMYTDTQCDGTRIVRNPRDINQTPTHLTDQASEVQSMINDIKNYVGADLNNPENEYNLSLGVEKDPWCMPYVGVKATSEPYIPFSPFGKVKITARAFSKPFGGRIGPWYGSIWPSNSPRSSGPKVDRLLPPRLTQNLGSVNDPTRPANFSRFVGDDLGMKSRRVLYQYGRGIYELDPDWKRSGTSAQGQSYADTAPNFNHWLRHLPFDFIDRNGNGDILAWDSDGNQPSRMRNLEMTAILPDLFDITYYSIDADFYNNYYLRIKNGLAKALGSLFDQPLRPDIGYHKGVAAYEKWNVRAQYGVLKDSFLGLDVDDKLPYITKSWMHLLTGWADVSLTDYSLDKDKFGKCSYPTEDQELPVPTQGNCVAGGSVGYKVKLISSDLLQNGELSLGGPNVRGPLKNPPPEDF